MKKPVLEKDIDLFRISVYPLGFSVEMIGKPKTFKSLCFSSGKNLVGGIDLTFIPYRLVTMNYEYYKSKFGEKFESWSKK